MANSNKQSDKMREKQLEHLFLMEVKRHPRPLQTARHKQLRKLGFKVYVLDNPQQIPEIIRDIGGDTA